MVEIGSIFCEGFHRDPHLLAKFYIPFDCYAQQNLPSGRGALRALFS